MKKILKIKQGEEIHTVQAKETASRGSLNKIDILKGLLMTVGTPIVISLWDALMAYLNYQPVNLDWRDLARGGLSAGAIYITHKLFDKSKIVIDKKEFVDSTNN